MLNRLVDAAFREFGGDAHSILHGVRVRRSVGNDADAFHPEQWRAAIFGVIESLLEIGKGAAGKESSDLPRDRGFQRFLERGANQVGDTFGNFQCDVANEAVRDDDVHFPIVEIASFDIADEVQRQVFQQLEGFAGEVVALGLFLADGEQSDARRFVFPNIARK